MVTLVGLLVALLVFLLAAPRRVRVGEASRRVAELYSLDTARTLGELKPETLEYKLLASGLRLQPLTFRLLTAAGGHRRRCRGLAVFAGPARPDPGRRGGFCTLRLAE